jgi:RimJ/RimL family protein N-acetyltransferase
MSQKMEKVFLEGKRVYLRPLEREDLAGDYRNWINDHNVTRYIEAGTFPLTDDELESFFEFNLKSPNNILFAIVEKKTGRHIGNAQIKNINWVHRTASRGILIGEKSCWGKGYGLEVANLLAEYAFERLNLNKLKSSTCAANAAVQKLNERAGYTLEGEAREEFFCDGKYYNRANWGLLRSEHLANKKKTAQR